MSSSPTGVAVTGVSGRVGQHLLALLDAQAGIDRIVGLDTREPRLRTRKLEFHAVDIGGADLKPLFEGVGVLVHLAFLFEPLPDEAVMARVNIEGTRSVLDAAAAVGVRKVVHVSTAAAYGAWPDNPVPITEDAPLRPNPGFAFALHKAETERMLAEWADEHPGTVVTVLRPAFVLGPDTPTLVRAIVRGSLPFRVRDAAPPVQYVHVEDLASAVALAVERDLPGAYNVAADRWLASEDAAELAGHTPRLALPADVAARLVRRLWSTGVGDVPPGTVPLLVHPWVVSNGRLRAAGWEPRHSNEEAILACIEASGAPRPSRVARMAVGAAVSAGAGTLAWALLRRRRR